MSVTYIFVWFVPKVDCRANQANVFVISRYPPDI